MGPRQKFLEDRQTVAQLFGLLLGRSRRAQELYLFTLSHILSESPSPSVISVEERIISTDYWTDDYPLGSFCAIIPTQVYVPYLEAVQGDPEALNEPLKSLDPCHVPLPTPAKPVPRTPHPSRRRPPSPYITLMYLLLVPQQENHH